jgi:hypothetical protein
VYVDDRQALVVRWRERLPSWNDALRQILRPPSDQGGA